MSPERWQQVNGLFEQALELPANERSAFLERACAADDEVRHEVESLLKSHAEAGAFIDAPQDFVSTEPINDAALLPGEMISPYRLLEEIGRGGMGAVYLAERADEQYEKRVAIKLIKRGMDTDSVLRRFRKERQILASFDHSNIARLLDGGTTAHGLPYFVMEYVEGLPLVEYCDKHAFLLRERLGLFREVCAAVSYAHRHLVIHRDIKNSNILVTAEGLPKLLDFGIATILQEGDAASEGGTLTGLRPMTPECASPEQIRGEPVTTLSDVYALGILLYALLTGRSPYHFTTHSPYDIARTVSDNEPVKPSSARTEPESPERGLRDLRPLRGDLDNIVLTALRKEPERRYQSVEQFSEDIRRHLAGLPVLARQDTFAYRASKFVRRNRVAVAAALLIFFSLLGGVLATAWQAHRARQEEAIALAEKRRAERRFNDVRALAHKVLFDYHDAIKNLPGATAVRERLVRDALVYLDSLAGEAGDDASLQRELAAAYEKVGDVRGQVAHPSFGDRAGALESYRKALRIREALFAAAPRDVENRRDLAVSYRRIGLQLLDTTEAKRGLEHLRETLALYAGLASEDGAYRDELAEIHNDIGSALESAGELAEALQHHGKALAIWRQLAAAKARDQTIRRSLSVTYENLGRAFFLSDDLNAALENNQKALALREQLTAEEPHNADYRRILGVSYQNKGDYQSWSKDTQGALASFRKKLEIDEESLAADPSNAQARGDLAYASKRMADLLAESGAHADSLPHYRRAIEMWEKIRAVDSQDLVIRVRVAIGRTGLGREHAALGQIGPGREECGKAAALLRAIPDDAANVELRRLRVSALSDLGDAYGLLAAAESDRNPAAGDWSASRHAYQEGLEMMRELRDRGILGADEIPELEEIAGKIANCDQHLTSNP